MTNSSVQAKKDVLEISERKKKTKKDWYRPAMTELEISATMGFGGLYTDSDGSPSKKS